MLGRETRGMERDYLSGLVPGGGAVTWVSDSPDFGHVWRIDQVSIIRTVAGTGTAIGSFQYFKNKSQFISGSVYPIQDTDSFPNTSLFNGETLTFVLTNANPNSIYQVAMIYTDQW